MRGRGGARSAVGGRHRQGYLLNQRWEDSRSAKCEPSDQGNCTHMQETISHRPLYARTGRRRVHTLGPWSDFIKEFSFVLPMQMWAHESQSAPFGGAL
jgi:hypothetical protein